ncbi:MobA-like NTP transferase protein [Rhodoglobus vestalii]|uniref:MobA-like NTP transferase protein n=1 Tax=Rhodoglobus vestalii TaxID=193384 RepID=A0A8H2PV16_9MICO|nr:NTP transferase domain-containing protein [Rhodoglobus vestalii]TQO20347.1 MobA-like NTP transferase protein [Rhodoglobus vestalii]
MLIDEAVLAGGRSSRLGSIAKASLQVDGHSLLDHAGAAVFVTREDPAFSGPAAALAAECEANRAGAPQPGTTK